MLDFSKANEWKIIETDFDPTALGKVEANFCLGNGYLGLRSATEEKYPDATCWWRGPLTAVYTSRDRELEGYTHHQMQLMTPTHDNHR